MGSLTVIENVNCPAGILKNDYEGQIRVMIGFEMEYFPSFDRSGYYKQLRQDPKPDFSETQNLGWGNGGDDRRSGYYGLGCSLCCGSGTNSAGKMEMLKLEILNC